ncbi:MAG: 2-oxoglutarate dehydrogenase E1 component, partial [Bacteroidales bacterium]|nr:2-oxoglutarate dehydrogenase E1 component [Bacteroidales bacterium]
MGQASYLSQAEIAVIDAYYQQYREDPASVEEGWRKFFEGFEFARTDFGKTKGDEIGMPDEFKVINLINAYRQRGHLFTLTNPVRTRRKYLPTLEIENFGLKESDLQRPFHAGKELGLGTTTLQNILDHLNETYSRHIGAEFFYIRNVEIAQWLRERMESRRNRPEFSVDDQRSMLFKLSEAVLFEKFIHKKFPGQKRFSLEGAEALIPALDQVIEHGAALGSKEFVIGMAHRGRLNVLANILRKPARDIFTEFEGKSYEDATLLGDVKYHLGFTTDTNTRDGREVRLTLAPNPSHLEAVGPVAQGISRARIDQLYQGDTDKVTPILIHGDASVAGQGVIYEIQQMSELPGYLTGGTIHLVINNQIGFTTNYLDARSSTYCTDVAKVTQSPVFHVNGDDVESLVYTINLAMDFRERFNRDVFIDILCYRKYGHNESDEPRFTQPLLYKVIEKHPDPLQIYSEKLLDQGTVSSDGLEGIKGRINEAFELSLTEARRAEKARLHSFLAETWAGIRKAVPEDFDASPETGISLEKLHSITNGLTAIPEGVNLFRKIDRLQQERKEMVFGTDRLDWAMGELLAYGSLLLENIPVRVSGQDVKRGTFSHRHAVLTQEDSGEPYVPLAHLSESQARFEIFNSPLSEYGVLGFEYGYA